MPAHTLSLTAHCSLLTDKRNLLAFSAGIDSSALFFLLIKNHIQFDIAIVDYGLREQSRAEMIHAKSLAEQYSLKCHTIKAPDFKSHFEQNARTFRYTFFEKLIKKYGYDTLLTAHQLNDQLEWLLMRLSKGAGLSELVGLEPVVQRKGYLLMRPLLAYSKEELLAYLEKNSHPYFMDASNSDESYERNHFRKQFSDPLITHYKEGISRSFQYLRKDKAIQEGAFETFYAKKELRIIKLHSSSAKAKAADLALKELGYLLSAAQRGEIEKERSLVIGGEWVITLQDNLLYIAPFVATKMPKSFKEQCRTVRIPPKIRPYLHQEKIDPTLLTASC